eukprot:2070990-Pyramimonas_sp.AAC.1
MDQFVSRHARNPCVIRHNKPFWNPPRNEYFCKRPHKGSCCNPLRQKPMRNPPRMESISTPPQTEFCEYQPPQQRLN